MNSFVANSLSETHEFATRIAKVLQRGDTIMLSGPLGSGKTTFTKTIVSKLTGLSQDQITSPTFNILKKYTIAPGYYVFHLDLYRVTNIEPLLDSGFFDHIDDNISIIEWPNLVTKFVPKAHIIHIYSETTNSSTRVFEYSQSIQALLG